MFHKRAKAKKRRQTVELAPFPAVALQVLELAGEPLTGPNELIEVVQTDAAISARILRLANSSLYGFRQRIDTLTAAGVALGSAKLIEVVMASAVSLYHASRGHLDERTSQLLWRRSLGTALAAQQTSADHGIDPGRAFFAGLFMPIGLLRFHQVYPERVVDRARAAHANGLSWRESQRSVFGLDHLQEGGRLVRDWELPAWIAASMEAARAERPIDMVGACLRQADLIACSLLVLDGDFEDGDHWSLDMPAVEDLVDGEQNEQLLTLLRNRTNTFDVAGY